MTVAPIVVDGILLLVAVEAVVIWRLGARLPRRPVLLTLAAGAFLLLAVRFALVGNGTGVLTALTAAFGAHLAYLTVSVRP